MAEHRKLTQDELLAEARKRFGDDPLDWAFECPNCGDVATARDFREALKQHPREDGGQPVTASILLGQECIGRTLGALKGPAGTQGGRGQATRGCNWAAYGLIPGPWSIVMPDGRTAPGFALADATARTEETAEERQARLSKIRLDVPHRTSEKVIPANPQRHEARCSCGGWSYSTTSDRGTEAQRKQHIADVRAARRMAKAAANA